MVIHSIGKSRHGTPQRHFWSRFVYSQKRLLDQSQGLGVKSTLKPMDLEKQFTTLTHLLYDTKVKEKDLEEHVYEVIHENITFTDPWQTITGKQPFITQLKGFHAAIFFDFKIEQISVQMYENEQGGRVLIDGWMNLNQLRWVTGIYPLRTILVYDFVMTGDGSKFFITDLEEMWSLADMIEQAPIMGWFYHLFRYGAGMFFTLFFLVCTIVVGCYHLVIDRSGGVSGGTLSGGVSGICEYIHQQWTNACSIGSEWIHKLLQPSTPLVGSSLISSSLRSVTTCSNESHTTTTTTGGTTTTKP
ncbi:hypothetical protein FDP41_001641 [Naegleria fowleri]|uniref:Uncharacterized protein n=1 Tax=Naegleria fowleri TaxID=5763 RepID=A0A6A5C062_NAEFO|nr:uncharacterized protein FDP41_001641 [Naegleria fowleri]KAF0979298.1 hypothetical protein FDP41_001641 [Naegleria fowleri]